jgi:hypothetical protein
LCKVSSRSELRYGGISCDQLLRPLRIPQRKVQRPRPELRVTISSGIGTTPVNIQDVDNPSAPAIGRRGGMLHEDCGGAPAEDRMDARE